MPEDNNTYDFGSPPSLEDLGWQQMRALLDQQLPVAGETSPLPVKLRSRVTGWLLMAAVLLLFFGFPIHTTDETVPAAAHASAGAAAVSLADNNNNHLSPIDSFVHHTSLPVAALDTPGRGAQQASVLRPAGGAHALQANAALFAGTTGNSNSYAPTHDVNAAAPVAAKQDEVSSSNAAAGTGADSAHTNVLAGNAVKTTPAAKDSTVKAVAKKTAKPIHYPALQIGAELNKTIARHTGDVKNLPYQLPVFPSVSIALALNKTWSIATGLAVFAPGNFKHPVSPQEPVSYASAQGIIVRSKESVQQVYYYKIPVMAKARITKHVSVQAGVDLALLQKVAVKREENYSNLVTANTTTDVYMVRAGAVGSSPVGQSYEVRRFDPRLTVGAQYEFGRFYAGVQYGQSLHSAVTYTNTPYQKSRNQLVNFTIGVNLFKKK